MADKTANTEEVKDETLKDNPVDTQEDTQVENNQPEEDKNWKMVRAKLKALEEENAKFKEAEKLRQEEELKKKGEYQQLLEQKERELEEYRTSIQKAKASNQLNSELVKHNLNPEAISLVENKALELAELDSEGNVTNLTDVIANLSQQYQFLFRQQVKTINPVGTQTNNGTPKYTIEQIKAMPISERPKNWTSLIIN